MYKKIVCSIHVCLLIFLFTSPATAVKDTIWLQYGVDGYTDYFDKNYATVSLSELLVGRC